MSRFLKFSDTTDTGAQIVRNGDWFADVKYLEFLRDIGRHFTINRMLAAECFKSRLDTGLTFLEFNYMLLQSYDFLHLYRTRGVKLQLGGDDQWSNILAGADLIRRMEFEGEGVKGEAFAMTFALLATKDGKKMGKTEKGALWLDADRTSPYDLYQYFRNVDDGDVVSLLKKMTFIPVDEIEEMENNLSGAGFNTAKERLAFELTSLVHGADEAVKAQTAAKSVFGAGVADENMPTVALNLDEGGKIGILDLLTETGLCKSKREARTAVEQGGISVGDEKITDVNAVVSVEEFVVVRKGKKSFVKVVHA
jgi:tyrosyl-tRNA synthetase